MIRASLHGCTFVADYYGSQYALEQLPASPKSTHRENRRTIRRLGDFLGRPATLADLAKPTLLEFRAWRLETGKGVGKTPDGKPKPLATATANKDIRQLRAIANHAADEHGLIQQPARLKPIKEPKREPEGYSIEDITALLTAAITEPGRVGRAPAGLWFWTLLSALYDTGARRDALMRSRWTDLDEARSVLLLTAEHQKQRADQRKEIHPDTLRALQTLRDITAPRLGEPIWFWPWGEGWFYSRLRKIRSRAALARLPKKPCHGLRASHATFLFDKYGLDAARESCGHASASTTMRHYIDPTLLSDRRTASQLPRPGSPPPVS